MGSFIERQWEKRFPCVSWLSERGLLLVLLFSLWALCQADQRSPLQMNSGQDKPGHQQVGNSQDTGVSGASGYQVYLCHNQEVTGSAPSRGRRDVFRLFQRALICAELETAATCHLCSAWLIMTHLKSRQHTGKLAFPF